MSYFMKTRVNVVCLTGTNDQGHTNAPPVQETAFHKHFNGVNIVL